MFVLLACVLVGPAAAQVRRPVTLAWDANQEPDLAGYLVMLGSEPDIAEEQIDVGLATSCALPAGPAAQRFAWVHAYSRSGVLSLPSERLELPVDDVTVHPEGGLRMEDWAREHGIDDPAADPDGDGASSYEEWRRQTDPNFPDRWAFADRPLGAAEQRFALVNLAPIEARGTLVLRPVGGGEHRIPVAVAPGARQTIDRTALAGLEGAASSAALDIVRGAVVAERTLRWPAEGGRAHALGYTTGAGSRGSTTWYFADADAGPAWETSFVLSNDHDDPVAVTLRFFPDVGTPVSHQVQVAPHSTESVLADAVPGLEQRSFWTTVAADRPVTVQRAIYPTYSGDARGVFTTGAALASTTWHFAEGQTGTALDTWLAIVNPNASWASVEIQWLRPGLAPLKQRRTLLPWTRTRIRADAIHGLADTEVAMAITSTLPIVAERAMYWGSAGSTWVDSHTGVGMTEPGTHWVLAEGEVGGPQAHETRILVSNAGASPATAVFTFLREDGASLAVTRTIPPMSRFTLDARDVGLDADERFGVVVDSDMPIAVERSLRWSPGFGVFGVTIEPGLRTR